VYSYFKLIVLSGSWLCLWLSAPKTVITQNRIKTTNRAGATKIRLTGISMNGMRVKTKRIDGTSRNIIRSIMILQRRREANRTIIGVGVTIIRITIGVELAQRHAYAGVACTLCRSRIADTLPLEAPGYIYINDPRNYFSRNVLPGPSPALLPSLHVESASLMSPSRTSGGMWTCRNTRNSLSARYQ